MFDLLLIGGHVILQDPHREIKKVNIGIKNGNIAYIGDSAIHAKNYFDATDCLISPAFINSHIHFGEYYLRGTRVTSTNEYIQLGERFFMLTREYADQIRKSSIDAVVLESILFGCLTLCGARAWPYVFEYPINYYLGYPLMNSAKLNPFTKDFEHFFDNLSEEERYKYYISLHSLQYTSTGVLQRIKNVKQRYPGSILSLHLCESLQETNFIMGTSKRNALGVLQDYGLVDKNTLLVHCNYITNSDIDIIEKECATVAVCYNSNLRLRNTPCEIKRLRNRNINIVAATDGPATGDALSLLDNLKTIGYLSGISSWDLFDMITVNPAKFFKCSTGQIKVGNKADLLMFDLNCLEFTYVETLVDNLIYSSGLRPKYVWKDGQIIVNDYCFCDLGKQQAVTDAKRVVLDLLRDLEVSNVLFKNDF